MNKFKLIKKYADEDSNNIMFSNITYSTPEQATKHNPFIKAFWFSFFWIFYSLQALTGNLKCKDNTQERLTQER